MGFIKMTTEYGIQTFTKDGIVQLDSRWGTLGCAHTEILNPANYVMGREGIWFSSFIMRNYGVAFLHSAATVGIRSGEKVGGINNIKVGVMTDEFKSDCEVRVFVPVNEPYEKFKFESNDQYGVWADNLYLGSAMLKDVMCITDYEIGDVISTNFSKPAVALSGQLFDIQHSNGRDVIKSAGVRINGSNVEIKALEGDSMLLPDDTFRVEFDRKFPIWVTDFN